MHVSSDTAIDELIYLEVENMFSFGATLIIAMLETVTHPNTYHEAKDYFNEREMDELRQLLIDFKAARSSD